VTGFGFGVLAFIVILGPLLFIHELGHFLVMKLNRIPVEEFGLGMPPRMFKLFERNGTEYTINWLLIGGFVRPAGEDDPSVPGGFCQWLADGDQKTFATSIAPADHWDLCDVVAVVSAEHKRVGSTGGHELADSSDLQAARVAGAAGRFAACKQALLDKDLSTLRPIIEEDAILIHRVMMTCRPPIFYWPPATPEIPHAVPRWRAGGLPVYFTIDAGPNVHLICESRYANQVEAAALSLPGVQKIFRSGVGGPTRLVDTGN